MPSANALRLQIERTLENRFPAALSPVPQTMRETAATGIAEIDSLLSGGFPVGAISEITGPATSGRTCLALAFIAERTSEGKVCAWIDVNDALDPESAAANGVQLRRLLWVRCKSKAERSERQAVVTSGAGFARRRSAAASRWVCRNCARLGRHRR
ncbi:MAG: ATPase domain-containing protein [Terracidiphilus sp.]